MKSSQYKLFVCKRADVLKHGIYNTSGLIFENIYNFKYISETIEMLVKDWVMVDYTYRNNVVMLSKDKNKIPERIKEYFNAYYEVEGFRYPPAWKKTINDIE